MHPSAANKETEQAKPRPRRVRLAILLTLLLLTLSLIKLRPHHVLDMTYTLGNKETRLWVLDHLITNNPEYAPLLIEAYLSKDEEVHYKAWGLLQENFRLAIPALTARFNSEPESRVALLQLCAVLDAYLEEVVPIVLMSCREKNRELRLMAAVALGKIPSVHRESLPTLMALLDDPESDIQRAALKSLAALGASARPALPRLRALGERQDRGLEDELIQKAIMSIRGEQALK